MSLLKSTKCEIICLIKHLLSNQMASKYMMYSDSGSTNLNVPISTDYSFIYDNKATLIHNNTDTIFRTGNFNIMLNGWFHF